MDAGCPRLPDTVLFEIFLYLDHADVLSVGLVCQQWRAVARDEFLWKELFYRYYRVSRDVPRHPGALRGAGLIRGGGICREPGAETALPSLCPLPAAVGAVEPLNRVASAVSQRHGLGCAREGLWVCPDPSETGVKGMEMFCFSLLFTERKFLSSLGRCSL